MAALEPGTWAFLFYGGDDVWHTRLLIGWVDGAEYVVCTPDFDTFIEEVSSANADLEGLRVGTATYELPVGIGADGVYTFNPPLSVVDVSRLCAEGSRLAATERQQRGLGLGVAVAAGAVHALAPLTVLLPLPVAIPGVPLGPRVAPQGGTWVIDEPLGPGAAWLGREIQLPGGGLDFGGRSIVKVEDCLCSVTRLSGGINLDEWVVARRAQLCSGDPRIAGPTTVKEPLTLALAHHRMVPDPGFTLVVAGPATVHSSLASSLEHTSGGLLAAHDKWVADSGIDPKHRSVFEHKVLCRSMQLAYSVDGLNIKNIHSFEYLNRRRQLLEEAHKADPKKPDFEGSDYFMGEVDASVGVHIAPSLRKHVAEEFSKQAALDKERRKAREAKK